MKQVSFNYLKKREEKSGMQIHKLWSRGLAMTLCMCTILGSVDLTAFAGTGTGQTDETETIVSVTPLADDIANQSLTVGEDSANIDTAFYFGNTSITVRQGKIAQMKRLFEHNKTLNKKTLFVTVGDNYIEGKIPICYNLSQCIICEKREGIYMGKSLPYHKFYQAMINGAETQTSQVNAEEFEEYFEKFLKEGKDVLHVCLSSGLSGVINSASVVFLGRCEK